MAYVMQNPLLKTGVALVITSEDHGTGKNTFADVLRRLNGPCGKTINSLKTIAGEFNATLIGAHLIVANELVNFDYDSRRAEVEALKNIITEDEMCIVKKGIDAYQELNIANLIMLSNHDNPIRIDSHDRRYCVMSTANKQEPSYYKALYKEIDQQEFYPALLYYLLHYDISNFDPMDKPMTDETKKLMNQSKPRIEQFIDDWRVYYYNNKTQLYELYKQYCKFYYSDKANVEPLKIFMQKITKYYNEEKSNGYRYIELNKKYKELYKNNEVRNNEPEDDEVDSYILTMIHECEITIKGKKYKFDTSKPFNT